MLLEIKYLRIIIVLLGLSFKQAIVAQEGSYEISVPRLQESVKIDGVLNEEVWNSAASFSNFSQVEPKSFAKPSQKMITMLGLSGQRLQGWSQGTPGVRIFNLSLKSDRHAKLVW